MPRDAVGLVARTRPVRRRLVLLDTFQRRFGRREAPESGEPPDATSLPSVPHVSPQAARLPRLRSLFYFVPGMCAHLKIMTHSCRTNTLRIYSLPVFIATERPTGY